jgi:hypothetical protein
MNPNAVINKDENVLALLREGARESANIRIDEDGMVFLKRF